MICASTIHASTVMRTSQTKLGFDASAVVPVMVMAQLPYALVVRNFA
jgi:hypothetical protein